jgi:hypothetical protein
MLLLIKLGTSSRGQAISAGTMDFYCCVFEIDTMCMKSRPTPWIATAMRSNVLNLPRRRAENNCLRPRCRAAGVGIRGRDDEVVLGASRRTDGRSDGVQWD